MDTELASSSENFFLFLDPVASSPFRALLEIPQDDDFAALRGESAKDKIRGRWYMGGSKPGDVIWSGSAALVLLSERVVELLRSHQITGWRAVPAELSGKDGRPISGYYLLQILGRCGAIDGKRSKVVHEQMPGGIFPRIKGLFFTESTWDGSDFFLSSDPVTWIFISSRVEEILRKAKIKNLRLVPQDQVERIPLEEDSPRVLH